MTLFERIQELSKKKNFASVKDLSIEAGLGVNAIYQWKKVTPRTDNLQKVADLLDTSVAYLLGETDDPHGSSYDPKYDPQTVKVINKIEKTGLNQKQLEVLDSYIDFLKTQFIEDMKKDDEN